MTVVTPNFSRIIKDIFKDSSFGVIKCFNKVFYFKNKINNIGFWIFLINAFFHISLFIFYIYKGIKPISVFVYREMIKNDYIANINNPIKRNNTRRNNNNNYIFKINNNNFSRNSKLSLTSKIDPEYQLEYNNILKEKNEKSNNNMGILYRKKRKINKNNSNKKSIEIINNEKNKTFPGYYNLIHLNPNNSLNNEPLESKYILDNYNYHTAIKYDKRSFFRIYYICLLSKESIINTFFFKSPLEIQSLRLSLFFFSYLCDFAFNALFYFNENISDKYHYKGENLYLFTILNNMSISIFSTFSGLLLINLLSFLTNSKDSIENIFRENEEKMRKNKKYKISNETKKNILHKLKEIYKFLRLKIILYIIFEFFIVLFFLYYIIAFCEIYKETQISFLIDSIISSIMNILVEFILSLLITIFYILSIRFHIEFLYKITLFLYGI